MSHWVTSCLRFPTSVYHGAPRQPSFPALSNSCVVVGQGALGGGSTGWAQPPGAPRSRLLVNRTPGRAATTGQVRPEGQGSLTCGQLKGKTQFLIHF